MTKELTHGKPLPLILQFAFPLILGYMLQQLYSLCDTVIVGRCLGVNELAAVGSTGAVSFLVVGFATGMCTGMSIPVAQAFGAGDYQKLRKYLANSFYLSALISIVMTVGTVIFTGDLLRLMKTPEELYDFAYDYIFTVFAGISATILYNLLSSMLRSIGDSRTPLIFLAIAAALNIGLDFLFILGFHTGVAGAGYASVLSQGISGILCLIYMFKKYEIFRIRKEEWKLSLSCCGRLVSIGLPMALQFSITVCEPVFLYKSYGNRMRSCGTGKTNVSAGTGRRCFRRRFCAEICHAGYECDHRAGKAGGRSGFRTDSCR